MNEKITSHSTNTTQALLPNTMSTPAPPHPPAAPHQAQAQPPQNQSDVPPGEQEPTYTIYGGDDGGSQLIQFHLASGQGVLLSGSTAGFLYCHPGLSDSPFPRQYLDGSSVTKDDLYSNSGSEPLLYLGAGGPAHGEDLAYRGGWRADALVGARRLLPGVDGTCEPQAGVLEDRHREGEAGNDSHRP